MTTIAIAGSICSPAFFAKNGFLSAFITFELLNLLAVILTITLASIGNIHLSLNRIARIAFKDPVQGNLHASEVRREINQNGWMLFYLFILSCGLLFLKGATENETVIALVNSLGLVILLTNLLVLYDIYQVIFNLVRAERISDERVHSPKRKRA